MSAANAVTFSLEQHAHSLFYYHYSLYEIPTEKKRGDADVVEGDDRARCPFDSLDFWFHCDFTLRAFWISDFV